jgi:ribosomal-protein-alanine N-acetyltransferase
MNWPSIETFCTDRLLAERLRPQHLSEYFQLFGNARVMATLSSDGKPLPAEVAAQWLQFSLEHWDRHGFGFWVFRTRDEKQFVGRAGLKHVHINGEDNDELSYALLPEFWDQGLATEIAGNVVKLAFGHIGLKKIICYTLTTNVASRRVMEKSGFRFDREDTHAELPHVFYRLTASEYWASIS